jgi:uncharacterized membrane protein
VTVMSTASQSLPFVAATRLQVIPNAMFTAKDEFPNLYANTSTVATAVAIVVIAINQFMTLQEWSSFRSQVGVHGSCCVPITRYWGSPLGRGPRA